MEKSMKNRLSHILSIILILFMVILTVATSYWEYHESLSYEFDDEYLIIKINTQRNPNDYVVYENIIYIHFKDKHEYQKFWNFIDDDGENLSMSAIIDHSKDPEIVEIIIEGEFVFETFVEDGFFIIKIERDILKYEDIKILEIYLYNQDTRQMEIHRQSSNPYPEYFIRPF